MNRDRPWTTPVWLMALVAVSAAAATAVGMVSEYGWLWGHAERGAVLWAAVSVIELGLLVWLVARVVALRHARLRSGEQ